MADVHRLRGVQDCARGLGTRLCRPATSAAAGGWPETANGRPSPAWRARLRAGGGLEPGFAACRPLQPSGWPAAANARPPPAPAGPGDWPPPAPVAVGRPGGSAHRRIPKLELVRKQGRSFHGGKEGIHARRPREAVPVRRGRPARDARVRLVGAGVPHRLRRPFVHRRRGKARQGGGRPGKPLQPGPPVRPLPRLAGSGLFARPQSCIP